MKYRDCFYNGAWSVLGTECITISVSLFFLQVIVHVKPVQESAFAVKPGSRSDSCCVPAVEGITAQGNKCFEIQQRTGMVCGSRIAGAKINDGNYTTERVGILLLVPATWPRL